MVFSQKKCWVDAVPSIVAAPSRTIADTSHTVRTFGWKNIVVVPFAATHIAFSESCAKGVFSGAVKLMAGIVTSMSNSSGLMCYQGMCRRVPCFTFTHKLKGRRSWTNTH